MDEPETYGIQSLNYIFTIPSHFITSNSTDCR